ncbi:hypothetical protein CK203_038068 [Vitis vinifera]|uniref:Uncharacterized protein n=1 Tax=Vitis vinifera TaxID=29760 RepID=A0A438HA26_VITVI|nr:hypothetical protein CK203_038068 [Vitis vinifera]
MSHLLTISLSSAILVPCVLSLRQLPLSLTKASISSSRNLSMDSSDSQHFQNVVVMRHGDRLDNTEPLWVSTAARPWDPPLADPGKVRAFCTGRKLRSQLGFPIHRVLVSPFLRCVQTASEVISALCAIDDDPVNMTGDGVAIDPSKLKEPNMEIRLVEASGKMMHKLGQSFIEKIVTRLFNTYFPTNDENLVDMERVLPGSVNNEKLIGKGTWEAIRLELAPKDGNWGFNVSELEAMLPAGTVDTTVERVYQELPQYEEGVPGSRIRYEKVIQALADKFPSENLLLVTHGEGVGVSISAFMKDATVYEVDYCAFSHSRRPIFFGNDESFTAGNFQALTKHGQTGISYYPLSPITNPV